MDGAITTTQDFATTCGSTTLNIGSQRMTLTGPRPGPLVNIRPVDRIREIRIQQLDNGYLINVGCQQFAIETPGKILSHLKTYFKEPAKTEKAWLGGKMKL